MVASVVPDTVPAAERSARRGTGIGSAVLAEAESVVRARGLAWIGLGVDEDNRRGAWLNSRLGYRDISCAHLDRYSYMLDDGTPHHVADPVRFLIKPCDPR